MRIPISHGKKAVKMEDSCLYSTLGSDVYFKFFEVAKSCRVLYLVYLTLCIVATESIFPSRYL